MDSLPRLLRLPCHPSRPPALPPAHGLPSHGLAGGGSDGVRQSPRLPDGEPPPAGRPKWREGRQLPRPRLLFVWRGGGEPRLAPGAAGLCQSLPRLGLPGPRTLRTLSAMLGDAALTPSLVFSLASCSPALWLSLCLQEAVGLSETRGPCQISRATDTPLSTQQGKSLAQNWGHLPRLSAYGKVKPGAVTQPYNPNRAIPHPSSLFLSSQDLTPAPRTSRD